MDKKQEPSASDVIDALGGTAAVATLLGLSQPAVSVWRRRGIPRAWDRVLRAEHPQAFKP